jgi:predicted transglutaminase-like cysteine proteinase
VIQYQFRVSGADTAEHALDLIREAISAHGGYEVKTVGDAFMIACKTPQTGVAIARDIQLKLQAEPWPTCIHHHYEGTHLEDRPEELTTAALASGSAKKASPFAREYAETLPPIGFVEFCQRHAEACQPNTGKQRKLAMDEEKWLLVRMVNAFVNGAIAPITDETLYGTAEYWTIPTDAGDCEDMVLLKKKILQQKGIPAEVLRITVVLDEQGEEPFERVAQLATKAVVEQAVLVVEGV